MNLPNFIIETVLLSVVLLVIVPAATDHGVAVRRGGFFRALITMFMVALLNSGLWLLVGLTTLGTALVANVLLMGLIGLLINGAAFWLFGAMMPEILQVRSFGSACFASLIMTVASALIHHLLI